MYLEDTVLHSLERVQMKLYTDIDVLESKIIKSNDEIAKVRMLRELDILQTKKAEVREQIRERRIELQKPKTFWEKLFRK